MYVYPCVCRSECRLVEERNRSMQQRTESLEETAQTASKRLLEAQQQKCTSPLCAAILCVLMCTFVCVSVFPVATLEIQLAESMQQLSEQQRLVADARRERDATADELAKLRVRHLLALFVFACLTFYAVCCMAVFGMCRMRLRPH